MTFSSTVMPKDVMMDIFSRLPAKTLCKLRCVCKEWRSLFSSRFFKSLHKARSSRKPNFLLLREKSYDIPTTTTVNMSSVDFDGNHNFDFTFTMDDYVCMLPSRWDLICFVGVVGFYVCNPTTQELVKLAKTSFHIAKYCCAFGYIKERNEFVLVNPGLMHSNTMCEVIRWTDGCCLKDRSWNIVNSKCPYSLRGWGVLVENTFYWAVSEDEYDSESEDEYDSEIVSFELGKEEFGTVVLPQGCFRPEVTFLLVELKGMLCLAHSPNNSIMNIWVMKDSKNHIWTKDYSFDLNRFDLGKESIVPLYHSEGKILMDVKAKSLEWYDVETKCFKRIWSGQLIWCAICPDSLFSMGSRLA